MPAQHGHTLLGLLVTLALAAVLVMLSAPGFSDLAHKARLDSATDRLHGAVRHARHAAVTRGRAVVIAATDKTWHKGWMIFVDANGDGRRQPGEERLATSAALPTSITAATNAGIGGALHYQPSGATRRLGGSLQMGTLSLCQRTPAGRLRAARSMIVNAAGRARIEPAAASAC
ncbi:hypothetical protein A6K26_005390 [Gammaproteobacteria bacterium 2W06]|nr:hypothetical protein A6K26_005390 [Gammaproteobacteria bacterium 2W06]